MRRFIKDIAETRRPKMYAGIIKEIASHIRVRRYHAVRSANREQLLLYYATGKVLSERVKVAEWGDRVLSVISEGIQNEFPGIRGFSDRNLKYMRQFFEAYPELDFGKSITAQIDTSVIGKLATAQIDMKDTLHLPTAKLSSLIPDVFFSVGFTHHILLLQQCVELKERLFYMQEAARNQWSVEVLRFHIAAKHFRKKGKLANNFTKTLPAKLTSHALEVFKDEYLLNFVNVNDSDGEEVLESELVNNLREFLMTLGREFAFLGNQYRVVVDEDEFFVDLLFFHRHLQSLVAIELKTGKFKPEYAGKMNFYLEALDSYVKLKHENPSIGIILCREKKNTIVEFAFKRIDRPMGVATYVLDEKLPPELGKHLPTAAQLKKIAGKGIRRS